MNSFFAKVTSAAAAGVVLVAGAVMAGLGFTVLAVLAMFALAAYGLAFLAAPFAAMALRAEENRETEMPQETAAAA